MTTNKETKKHFDELNDISKMKDCCKDDGRTSTAVTKCVYEGKTRQTKTIVYTLHVKSYRTEDNPHERSKG